MNLLKSIIFTILLCLWGAIVPVLYSFAFITRSSKTADHGAKVWAQFSLWMLKKICGIDHKILGLEKLPKEPCIIACQHQSMWETIVMHLIVKRPVYAYKTELLKIPFYGWYLTIMSGIKVDRKGGASALKSLIKQAKKYLSCGQTVIIFPQGTRTPLNANTKDYPYQSGIAALYLSCGVKVAPATLNSGKFWPRKGSKLSGTIVLEFLDPIETGLDKKTFMYTLENTIESSK
jgi:1-acyl-sn-glycerol-3-phosphate acyltransferase